MRSRLTSKLLLPSLSGRPQGSGQAHSRDPYGHSRARGPLPRLPRLCYAVFRRSRPREPAMSATFKTLDELDLSNKRVLLRADLNVPVTDGKVTDATRIERLVPTIREIVKHDGKAILLSHFGRPKGK